MRKPLFLSKHRCLISTSDPHPALTTLRRACVPGRGNFSRARESGFHAEQSRAATPARSSGGARGAIVHCHLSLAIAESWLCGPVTSTQVSSIGRGATVSAVPVGSPITLTWNVGVQVETHVFTSEPSDTYNVLQHNSQKLASDLEALGLHVVSSRASILVSLMQTVGPPRESLLLCAETRSGEQLQSAHLQIPVIQIPKLADVALLMKFWLPGAFLPSPRQLPTCILESRPVCMRQRVLPPRYIIRCWC